MNTQKIVAALNRINSDDKGLQRLLALVIAARENEKAIEKLLDDDDLYDYTVLRDAITDGTTLEDDRDNPWNQLYHALSIGDECPQCGYTDDDKDEKIRTIDKDGKIVTFKDGDR